MGVLVGKQGLSLKQQGKIYQWSARPVLLYSCETWKLTFTDDARLRGGEVPYDQDDLWGESDR